MSYHMMPAPAMPIPLDNPNVFMGINLYAYRADQVMEDMMRNGGHEHHDDHGAAVAKPKKGAFACRFEHVVIAL